MATDVGTATTITLTGLDSNFIGAITSVEWSGWSAESVETTHMGTSAARTFISSDLYDPGEIALEGHFQPANALPSFGTAAAIVISFAGVGTANRWTVNGFITDFTIGDPLEDIMTFSATFKATGAVTKT